MRFFLFTFVLLFVPLLFVPSLLGPVELFAEETAQPFGSDFPNLDSHAVGQWWTRKPKGAKQPRLQVPRDQVVSFAVYAHDRGVLKLTCQLYPLMPDEPREVTLELMRAGEQDWREVATEPGTRPSKPQQSWPIATSMIAICPTRQLM